MTTFTNYILILQSDCNERGTCGCDGTCSCQDPYFGDYCELCSGSEVCFDLTCDSNSPCAECAITLFQDIGTDDESVFFSDASLGNLPGGSKLNLTEGVYQVTLPEGACRECDQGVVIINGTEEVDYMIDGGCMHIIIIIASVKLLLIRLFVCLFVYLFICLFVCLFVCLL